MNKKQYSLEDKSKTWEFFNRISGRYDLLNRVLSLGIDVSWRKKVVRRLPAQKGLHAVDLGTGTGDFMMTLIRYSETGKFASYVGIDPAKDMLAVGQKKAQKNKLEQVVSFQEGDATALTFLSDQADVVTMSFAIRNVPNVPACLSEIRRILRPGGKTYILEFSIPRNPIVRVGYLTYFRWVLPLVGGLLSGDRAAYAYLNKSVEAFPYGDSFLKLMKDAGFRNPTATPLTFGIATLYQGEK